MTDLAYLNSATTKALDREANCGPPAPVLETVKIGKQNIYGFSVPDDVLKTDAQDDLRRERCESLKRHREDALRLTRVLDTVGIKPKAIITTKAWDRILELSGLYILQPGVRGQVMVSCQLANEFRESRFYTKTAKSLLILASAASAVWLGFWLSHLGFSREASLFSGIALGFVVGFIGSIVISALEVLYNKKSYKRKYEEYIATHDWPMFLKDLARRNYNGCAYFDYINRYDNSPQISRKLVLPSPPERVVKTIRAVNDIDNDLRNKNSITTLQIAAVPEAINFEGGMRGYFDNAHTAIEAHEEWLRRDPILFVECRSAVAALDQFGDFPIEREVIDAVLASEHLL